MVTVARGLIVCFCADMKKAEWIAEVIDGMTVEMAAQFTDKEILVLRRALQIEDRVKCNDILQRHGGAPIPTRVRKFAPLIKRLALQLSAKKPSAFP